MVDQDSAHAPLLARFFQALLLNFLKKAGKVRIIEHMRLRVAFDPPGHPENALHYGDSRLCLYAMVRFIGSKTATSMKTQREL